MTKEASNSVRYRVCYSGDVQGVGFRMTTYAVAKRFPVVGFVLNQADGRVLLEIQGKRSDVRQVLDELERYFRDRIDEKQIQEKPTSDGEDSFSIRR